MDKLVRLADYLRGSFVGLIAVSHERQYRCTLYPECALMLGRYVSGSREGLPALVFLLFTTRPSVAKIYAFPKSRAELLHECLSFYSL